MRGVAKWGRALALLLLLAPPGTAAADEDDDDPDAPEKVDTIECLLGKKDRGTLETTTERETCGSGGCSQEETVVVSNSKGDLLIGVQNRTGDFDNPPQFTIDCHAGAVEVKGAGVAVTFAYDDKQRRLRLPADVRKTIDQAPGALAKGAKAAARERLAELLDEVVPKPPEPNQQPDTPILDVDHDLVQSLWLAVMRDKIEAGEWDKGEKMLWRVPAAPPPAPAVARQRQALVARLAALRRQSVPVVATKRQRIGTTLSLLFNSLDADFAPGIFWRKGSLCVAQEDHKPPTEMRCLDPATRRWAPREPLEKPISNGENLRRIDYPEIDRCYGRFIVQRKVPETDKSVCSGAPGENDDALVGIVDGDALLIEDGKGLRLNRGPKKNQNLTWPQADALLRTTGGTYLAGDGCCRFRADGRLVRIGNGEQSWEIRGDPPEGQRWAGPPLVSPSQKWAVAISKGEAPATTLWLLGLKRR